MRFHAQRACTFSCSCCCLLAAAAAAHAVCTHAAARAVRAAPQVSKGKEVKPVWCLAPDGRLLAMHEADVVFMSYEQLRDELQHTTNT